MSEDRRAAPSKVVSDVPPTTKDLPSSGSTGELAAIDGTAPPDPASRRVPSAAPPSSSTDVDSHAPRGSGRDSSPGVRRRARMTLRIPDDEVSRPSQISEPPPPVRSAPPPPAASAPPPAPDESLVPLVPARIITINPSPSDVALPPVDLPPPASTPRPVVTEDSWTPFQPRVEQDGPDISIVAEAREKLPSDDMIPIEDEAPPPSDSAPESIEPLEEGPSVPPPPPTRPRDVAEPEGEDIRFDDDAPTPHVPAVEPAHAADEERHSDPGAEIAAEDLVAVSSDPSPGKSPAPLPPMRPRLTSQPPIPPPPNRKATAPKLAKPPLVIVPPHVGTMAPQTGEGTQRRKGRLWWEDLFNDDYLRACEKLTDEQIAREADFVEDSLSVEKGGTVLDLGCGTGRHAIELARRGYEVVGYDLSLAMLARAGEDAQDREAKLNFIQGDMREMDFDEQFDGVFCWNTTFGYFEEDKNALVVDRIHKSLKAEGLLLLDVVNRDFLIRQSPSLCWFEGDGCVCMDEMSVDFITSRMKVKRTIMLDDGRSREIEYSMRVYSLHELGRILHEHGFKVCEVSGRTATPGVFFGNESPRIIILAEKR